MNVIDTGLNISLFGNAVVVVELLLGYGFQLSLDRRDLSRNGLVRSVCIVQSRESSRRVKTYVCS